MVRWLHVYLLCCLPALIGCPLPDDETLVERRIRGMVKAAQNRDLDGIMSRVAETFEGPRGIDRSEVKRMLAGRLLSNRWVRVFERDLQVTVNGDAAEARLRAVLAQGNKAERLQDILPTDASYATFNIKLSKQDGIWWVVASDYKKEALTIDSLSKP